MNASKPGYFGKALVAIGLTLAVSLVLNLVTWFIARAAGVDFVTQVEGRMPLEVTSVPIVVMTVVPVLLGGILLLILGRWLRAWNILAIVGLGVGVLSVIAPFTVQASTGTSVSLAIMHLVVGGVWFLALRRGASHRSGARR